MATRLKTINHAFTTLASLTNNTLTNLTQTTVYIPESSPTFRSVTAHVTCDDIITVTGGTLTTKTFGLRLGAAAYSSVSNANTLTHSSRNGSFWFTADYTSYFTSNWSGTSSTCDFQVTINQSTGTTLGMVNVCVTLEITYEYDDTSSTHIKTVKYPLNATVGALTAVDTTYDTIPALGYFLAEGSKTIRNAYVVLEGNTALNGSTTDHTITIHVGTATVTTGNYEAALSTDRYFRYVWELSGSWPSTTATQAFQLSDTVGRCNHLQAYLVVTYEFKGNATSTTLTSALADGTGTTVSVTDATVFGTAPYVISVDNEQMLVTSVASNDLTVTRAYNSTTGVAHSNGATVKPCATNSVVLAANSDSQYGGGTTSSDYLRLNTKFYIQEPGPITAGKIAAFVSYTEQSSTSGLNMRIGTGSFVAYTDNTTTLAGSVAAMVRNDSAFTLARGLNTLNFDVYTSHAYLVLATLGVYWMVNYVSSLASAGHGSHNHTVAHNIVANGTSALTARYLTTATAPSIPETDYYINNVGTCLTSLGSNTASGQFSVSVERLAAEGGVGWDGFYSGGSQADANVGTQRFWADGTRSFKRWPADTAVNRMDVETSRRYRWILLTGSGGFWPNLCLYVTYHSVGPFTVSDNVTGSDGGTVTIGLYRSSDGELLKSTTRAGNGAYSFDWWDNTENVFTACTDATGNTARSKDGLATGSP